MLLLEGEAAWKNFNAEYPAIAGSDCHKLLLEVGVLGNASPGKPRAISVFLSLAEPVLGLELEKFARQVCVVDLAVSTTDQNISLLLHAEELRSYAVYVVLKPCRYSRAALTLWVQHILAKETNHATALGVLDD